MKTIIFVIISVFATISTCQAQVVLSEIMYDPEGTDTGREWIEIQNVSTQSVDLSKWKLFEEGANHSLSFSDGPSLSAGAFAIITTDRAQFTKDYPNVVAKLIQASFSLKNTGESVGLKNESGSLIEEYLYQVSLGGGGNGESIQKLSLGYAAGIATPAAENASVRAPEQPVAATTPSASNSSSSSQIVIPSSQSPYRPWPTDRNVYVNGGGNRVVVAGADSVYEARALGIDKKPLENVTFYWTFGDGGTETGRSVRHYFRYPGTYVVLLDAISGDYISSDHIEVLVINPEISVTGFTEGESGYIELANKSEYELDLSGWILETDGIGGSHFVFPKKSLILPQARVKFPNDITKLKPKDKNIRILFPNSEVVFDMATLPVEEDTSKASQTIQQEDISKKIPVQQEIHTTEPVIPVEVLPTNTQKIVEPVKNQVNTQSAQSDTSNTGEAQEDNIGVGSDIGGNTQAAMPIQADPRLYLAGFVCTLIFASIMIWYAQKSGVLDGEDKLSDEADTYDIMSK